MFRVAVPICALERERSGRSARRYRIVVEGTWEEGGNWRGDVEPL